MDNKPNVVYLVICAVPEKYGYPDVSIYYAGTSRNEAIRVAQTLPKSLQKYTDIQVWVNGQETMEYVTFTFI